MTDSKVLAENADSAWKNMNRKIHQLASALLDTTIPETQLNCYRALMTEINNLDASIQNLFGLMAGEPPALAAATLAAEQSLMAGMRTAMGALRDSLTVADCGTNFKAFHTTYDPLETALTDAFKNLITEVS